MKKFLFAVLVLCAFCGSAFAEDDAEKMMATYLNLKGQLCAQVVNVSKLTMADTYEVRCIEYRGGSGTVDYIVNVKKGEVFKK